MKYMTEDGEIVDTICEDCQVLWKTPHNHDTQKEAELTATRDFDESKTDQSFKDEADINVLTKRMKLGMPVPPVLPEHFTDRPTLDYHAMRTIIAESNATFYNLAPDIREEFLNDPGRWETQVQKDMAEGNIENLDRMGLKFIPRQPEAATGGTPAQEPPKGAGGGNPPPEPPKD